MRASAIPASEYVPTADHRVVLHRISWAGFEELLRLKGDASTPRLAYIGGELELMSPSKRHEYIKSLIGRLAEAYADEVSIELSPYGSWTLKNAPLEAGVEPDECYIVGPDQDKDVPDLVIEVVWTSGGLDKLEIYRRLGIREFWQWKAGRLSVHVLRKGRYVLTESSVVLPGLDVNLLASCLDRSTRQRALRAFRQLCARRLQRSTGSRRRGEP
ncbi:MAG: Uma2 family endonuclease [Candidatus Riflebacteria bacterium]|nr:Uma2 family endonuclease [Candidatus Riflebacteria bacterium]